jgi:hypothetical protein
MNRKAIALLTLALALVIVPLAAAGQPFKFSDRAAFEAVSAKNFVTTEKSVNHVTYSVRSIGCAKSGVGRAACIVVATSPDTGTLTFTFTVSCPDDKGQSCTGVARPL